jgi:hypothetical protein
MDMLPVASRQPVAELPAPEAFDIEQGSFVPIAVSLLFQCNRALKDVCAVMTDAPDAQPSNQGLPARTQIPVRGGAASRDTAARTATLEGATTEIPTVCWHLLWRQEVVLYLRHALALPGNARAFGRCRGYDAMVPLLVLPIRSVCTCFCVFLVFISRLCPCCLALRTCLCTSATTETLLESGAPAPAPSTDGLFSSDESLRRDPDEMLIQMFPKHHLEPTIVARSVVHGLALSFGACASNYDRFKQTDLLQFLMLAMLQVCLQCCVPLRVRCVDAVRALLLAGRSTSSRLSQRRWPLVPYGTVYGQRVLGAFRTVFH